MTGEDIVGYETMLKVTPNDAELHDDVALLYLGMGFAANAVRHFQASAALKPESAAAHFNLGTALAQAGRLDESVRSFRDALSRRPDYALAHGNLGRVLLVKGDVRRGARSTSRRRCGSIRTIRKACSGCPRRSRSAATSIARSRWWIARCELPLNEHFAREIRAKRELYRNAEVA